MSEFEHLEKELDTVQDGCGDADATDMADMIDTADAGACDNTAQTPTIGDADAAQGAADAPPESKTEVDPTTLYDPITNRVRLLIARDIDPTDKVRVYIRIIVVAGIIYYIGTGVWGVLMG